MIEFSIDNYNITVFVGQVPTIIDHYKKHSIFIDDKDLKNEGTEVYVIISKGFLNPSYSIIAFRSDPVGYAGFRPGLHYEKESDTLFIGAGRVIKTYRLSDNKLIFEKNHGFGFWSWTKYSNFILQQEETDFGVFNLQGEQLWETFVSPPYEFSFVGDNIILKFDDIIEKRNLVTGAKS
ncbi:hypothetical protein WSM22_36180 [Cytophagales bacterium WSM2-2]|nr:hypothetical protein WSM22_36180 [Cytophagales bacterium WSM2-2]